MHNYALLLNTKNREIRLEAINIQTAFFAENETTFDTIYDELIKVRTEIAHKLGFENYVAFADVQMNRWDYDRKNDRNLSKGNFRKSCPNHSKAVCPPSKT